MSGHLAEGQPKNMDQAAITENTEIANDFTPTTHSQNIAVHKKPRKRHPKRWIIASVIVLLLIPLGIDRYVIWSTQDQILSAAEISDKKADAILVLGAYAYEDGTLSPMLEDRMKVGVELYKAGVSEWLVLSGDGGAEEYDETAAMKRYAMENGVPEEAIIRDDKGLSTYTSVYRAKHVGQYSSLVIVTQQYHLYRSLYAANRLGIKATGVPADLQDYFNQIKRDIREILARNKDFIQCISLPEPPDGTEPYLLPDTQN